MSDDVHSNLDKILSDLSPERIRRNQQIYANLVAEYYGDPDFKAMVDADPTRVLKAAGLEIPEGMGGQAPCSTPRRSCISCCRHASKINPESRSLRGSRRMDHSRGPGPENSSFGIQNA